MQIINYSQCCSNSIIIVTLGELYPERDPQNGYFKDSKELFQPQMTLKMDIPRIQTTNSTQNEPIRSLTLKMDISRIQIYMQYQINCNFYKQRYNAKWLIPYVEYCWCSERIFQAYNLKTSIPRHNMNVLLLLKREYIICAIYRLSINSN